MPVEFAGDKPLRRGEDLLERITTESAERGAPLRARIAFSLYLPADQNYRFWPGQYWNYTGPTPDSLLEFRDLVRLFFQVVGVHGIKRVRAVLKDLKQEAVA